MNFPADYNVKMFSGTRYLALARLFAIISLVLFLLITALTIGTYFLSRTRGITPVLISVSNDGATWSAVLQSDQDKITIPAWRAMTESVLLNDLDTRARDQDWDITRASIRITPVGIAGETDGLWQITFRARVKNIPMNIIAYSHITRADSAHAETLGYYVDTFNAYPGE
ncbi:MAG: hypothetical protein LBL75_02485 [Rickettsiales bacterium]|jgi:hypothetical protein|nr:hypothetical protein [Rickettsiales bacterium]